MYDGTTRARAGRMSRTGCAARATCGPRRLSWRSVPLWRRRLTCAHAHCHTFVFTSYHCLIEPTDMLYYAHLSRINYSLLLATRSPQSALFAQTQLLRLLSSIHTFDNIAFRAFHNALQRNPLDSDYTSVLLYKYNGS
ncbi:unnamed protein product [Chrysodeixis includens]|uniref:Uncharacterized protein n=1 Tax=Chrysodeixis includens TaxID=689277 RepID=A0A9N8KSF8_CHRIL|nr:unnamed protein product [Chrysodeixis includens]